MVFNQFFSICIYIPCHDFVDLLSFSFILTAFNIFHHAPQLFIIFHVISLPDISTIVILHHILSFPDVSSVSTFRVTLFQLLHAFDHFTFERYSSCSLLLSFSPVHISWLPSCSIIFHFPSSVTVSIIFQYSVTLYVFKRRPSQQHPSAHPPPMTSPSTQKRTTTN